MAISANNIYSNSMDGIYLNSSSPVIIDNLIYSNLRDGINCYNYSSPSIYNNSYPSVYNNAIYSNNVSNYTNHGGIYCDNHSSAKLGYYGPGYNVIRYNTGRGIYANSYSNVFTGYAPDGGLNSIYSNTSYEIDANNNSIVFAENNWWGSPFSTNEFRSQNGSSIDYSPQVYPYTDPNGGLPKSSSTDSEIAGDDDSVFDDELKAAIDFQFRGKYNEAINIYKRIIQYSLGVKKSIYALTALSECYEQLKNNQFTPFIVNAVKNRLSTESPLNKLIKELEIHWLIIDGKYNEAISGLDNIITEYTSDYNAVKHALFNKGYIYFSFLNDIEKAELEFSKLEKLYPDDDLVIDIKLLLGKTIQPKNKLPEVPNNPDDQSASVSEYELLGNYPNPFNPTTVIKYTLPKISDVELRIYDILGKEIKTFIINAQASGNQNITWNGTNNSGNQISSGIYIYHFIAKSLEDGRVFNKSAKLLMME